MGLETESPTVGYSANLMGSPTWSKHLSILGKRLQDSPSSKFRDSVMQNGSHIFCARHGGHSTYEIDQFLCTFNLLIASGVVSSACSFQMFFPSQISANKVTHRHTWIPT